MKASTLISKIDSVLNRVSASDRKVYKRVYTRTGGVALLGRNGTVTKSDTILSPKPTIMTISKEDLLALSGTAQVQLNDLMMLVSPTALTRAELGNKDLVILLKDGSAETEYGVEGYTVAPFDGSAVLFSVLLRSKRRP